MSNLLSQASLVMIPSGYKEDVVYSAIPTNGNGDLSFTRASNGTRVNSAGLVEVCPWNLLEYSEQFDNAYWNKYQSTITSNSTTAPNGTTTADLITISSTTAEHNLYAPSTGLAITPNQTYTFSYYVKKGTARYFCAWMYWTGVGSGPYATFDLNTGLLVANGATSGTYVSSSIESLNDGWYRISVSGYGNYSSLINAIDVRTSGSLVPEVSWLGAGETVYIWGAQLNIGSTAKPYFPTTDRLNVPRLTYQNGGGGCPSLLLEKQSTNLVTYSEDFSNVSWLNNGTIVVNQAISPDGTQNADLFYANTGSVKRVYKTATITSSTAYSVSIFAKASGKNFIFITDIDNSNEIWFNLSNGTFTSPIVGTATMVDYGNGWYKCSYTTTSTTTTGYAYVGVSDTSGSFTFTANGTDGVYLWGAQMEASSYPTSYIPTTSSSATRVADACFKTGISSLIGQTEGVMFADFNFEQKGDTSGNIVILLRGSSSEAYIYLTSSNVQADFISGGIQCSIVGSIGAVGRKKIAFAYKQNDFALYINGVQIGTDSSGTVGSLTALTVGSYDSPGYLLNSGINQAALFPTRLTNAELASLTTI